MKIEANNYFFGFDEYSKSTPKNLLAVHGNLSSRRWWKPLAENFCYSNYQNANGSFFAYDWRGCGETSLRKTNSENINDFTLSLNDLADDLIAIAKSKGHGQKMDLIGHSTGGIICLMAMAKNPEAFGSAVLLDPVAAKGIHFDKSMWDAFKAMQADKEMTGKIIGSTIYNCDFDSKFFREVIREDAFHSVKNAGIPVLNMLNGINLTENFKKISNPVLVLHGEFDKLLPVEDSIELSNSLKNGLFESLSGCGHCGLIENPELLKTKIQRFLWDL